MYYFDIGSSTIKLYEYKNELTLIEEKSIMFKKGFSEEGIQEENIEKMMTFIQEAKEKYNLNKNNTEIYATGIWRKIPNEQLANIEIRFNELDLKFNVISHDKENYYFEKAMQGTYKNRVMMVNMGGKTTELVIFNNDTVENRVNLTVGVSDVFDKYPNINELDSGISKEEIINYLEKLIQEDINFNCDIAIHTGGELRFQKLVKYNLKPNKFFDDGIHKVYVTYKDFDKKNEELLNKTTLDELRSLMPTNPDWMNGAKAGIMLGEAIFRKANIKNIIPSDLNLINGVIKAN
jgi:exopolyphosphatase/pppGpp-phosphohydrolase